MLRTFFICPRTLRRTDLSIQWNLFGSTNLANTLQAKKRVRQAEKHRQHNASRRSAMRSAVKKAISLIADGDKPAATAAYQAAASAVDRAARKGLIHPNKAARHKSRLGQRLNALQA